MRRSHSSRSASLRLCQEAATGSHGDSLASGGKRPSCFCLAKRASRRIVELRELQPSRGYGIQVRRCHITPITTEIREAKAIREDEQHDWARSWLLPGVENAGQEGLDHEQSDAGSPNEGRHALNRANTIHFTPSAAFSGAARPAGACLARLMAMNLWRFTISAGSVVRILACG